MPPEDQKTDTFRKEYTPLSDGQKTQMADVKDQAQLLLDLIDSVPVIPGRSERGRCLAIARTELETAVMWAVKGITSK